MSGPEFDTSQSLKRSALTLDHGVSDWNSLSDNRCHYHFIVTQSIALRPKLHLSIEDLFIYISILEFSLEYAEWNLGQ